jgi:hypothetical protein
MKKPTHLGQWSMTFTRCEFGMGKTGENFVSSGVFAQLEIRSENLDF